MRQGIDYDLIEHNDEQWAISYQGIEFILDELAFDEYQDELDEASVAVKIKYTIISDTKPVDKEDFDEIVGEIVHDVLETMDKEQDIEK